MADDEKPGGFAQRLGAEAEATGEGTARVRFEAREEHLNPAGTLHGGVLATVLERTLSSEYHGRV